MEQLAFDSDAIASAAASALIPPQTGCTQLRAGPHCCVHCWLKNKFNFRSANTTRSHTKHTHNAQHSECLCVFVCLCRFELISLAAAASSRSALRAWRELVAKRKPSSTFFLACHNYLLPHPLQALMMKCSRPATKKPKRMRDEAFDTLQSAPTHPAQAVKQSS